jgi:hypothetical protein
MWLGPLTEHKDFLNPANFYTECSYGSIIGLLSRVKYWIMNFTVQMCLLNVTDVLSMEALNP